MPWCPVCKNEYREGIERCAECKVTLVDSLEEETENGEQERTAEREKLARLQAMIAAQEQGQQEDGEEEATQSSPWHPYQNSAAKAEDKKETIYEIADLAYHVMVLMVEMGISVDEVLAELASRHVIDHKVKQEKMT